MFKLKRLEITGFKSFADYTEIVFTGNGITAVVGPNGCGKSNVSDAISWVLGEQSPKSLRGQEMKDVVFQGSGKRGPGGMAEVVLHLERDGEASISDESELEDIDERLGELDESAIDIDALEAEHLETDEEAPDAQMVAVQAVSEDTILVEVEDEVVAAQAAQVGSIKTITTKSKRRWKPRSFALDFAPGEAISVTRRLYRSGESEYLLNNKTCRLRDIHDLFAGTGLSGAHYAIIEQGRIGQILSSKPSDRRALIEEAAGISKFKTRQRAAESRLESAKSNLGRISDIVDEIEQRTRSLRRQANKTRRYKILKEELRELQTRTYAVESTLLTATLEDLREKLRESQTLESKLRDDVTQKETALREATENARLAEGALTELRSLHAENALERDRAQREKRYQEEQIAELEKRILDLEEESKVTRVRIEGLASEITATTVAAAEETEAAEAEKQKLATAEAKYRDVLASVRGIEARLDEQRNEQLKHTAAVERLAEVGRRFETEIERATLRVAGLEKEKERALKTLESSRSESERVATELEKEKARIEKARSEKSAATGACDAAREDVALASEELSKCEAEFSRCRHRLDTLRELEETGAIYEPSVQKLLSSAGKIGIKLHGTLADRFATQSSTEKAVEALFGPYLQSVIVESRADAVKAVEYLNKNDLGRIPVLAIEGKGAGSVKPNSEIVAMLGIDADFAYVLADVFPAEMGAALVDSVDQAKGNGRMTVSKDGDLVFGGRLFVSGAKDPNAKNTSLLAFKREVRELEKVSGNAKKEVEKAQKLVENAKAKLGKAEDNLVDIQSFIVQLERDFLSKEIQAASIAQEIDRSERHAKVVGDEIGQLSNELEMIGTKKIETGESAGNAEKARSDSERRIAEITSELADARRSLDEENLAYNQTKTFAEVVAERMRAAVAALERVNSEKSELESRLERHAKESENTRSRISELHESAKQLGRRLIDFENEIASESKELSEAVEHLRGAREASDLMSSDLAGLNKRSAEARDARASIEIKSAEVATRLQNVGENCLHDLGIEITDLAESIEIEDDFEFESARERVENLRNRLENFGAINMLAVEELAETEERLEFLSSQRQDVIDSIASAEEALFEIKRRSRERFKNAFESINENFTKFFLELFGGGKGEMTLLESEDVLEAGIEIVAQPPGKRLQNMLLLSGGEKAMTAIALVLAIFKYRPSPFCLLDEVDAPLDDANVGRFVDRVASMSENTQFIVITHNKRTMEAAKALYGVTMQEAGVSKVVSVRFE
ncbi:MAG: chromosome segregation protein SMC [Pyrinomonadaceae bacterium]